MEFQETEIVCGQGIHGLLTRPIRDLPVPAVLMLHGFASHRNEVGNMYERLAHALAGRQIASLRIDFRGWGSSEGDMADTTVPGQVEDARAAYAALCAQPFVDRQRVGLVGFSLGASVAAFTAAQLPDEVRTLVLWSSTHDLHSAFMEELGAQNFAAAAQHGQVTIDLGFRIITLKRSFFSSLDALDMSVEFGRYTGTLLVVAGSDDHSARSLPWYRERAQGHFTAFYLVPGADHIFNVLSDDQSISNSVIEKTAAWLAMSLA